MKPKRVPIAHLRAAKISGKVGRTTPEAGGIEGFLARHLSLDADQLGELAAAYLEGWNEEEARLKRG